MVRLRPKEFSCLLPCPIISRHTGWCPKTPVTAAAARSPPRSGGRRRHCSSGRLLRNRLVCFAELIGGLLQPSLVARSRSPPKRVPFRCTPSIRAGAWHRCGAAPVPCRTGTRPTTQRAESSPGTDCLFHADHQEPSRTFPLSEFACRQTGWCQNTPVTAAAARAPPRYGNRRRHCAPHLASYLNQPGHGLRSVLRPSRGDGGACGISREQLRFHRPWPRG